MGYSAAEVADRLEIHDVLVRYATAIDTRDWDLLDECFAPGAVVDYTASGGIAGPIAEVKAWLARTLAAFAMTQHVLSNFAIDIAGDRATARTYLHNPMGARTRSGPLHTFFLGGHYDDELVRTTAGWRIQSKTITISWMDGTYPPELLTED